MIIGVIGSGGREHAICHALNKSKKVNKIYCFPGNAGTSKVGTNINIDINNFDELKNIVLEKKINLLVVGPEKPLVDGIVDFFEKKDIKIFGPNKVASNLRGRKYLLKNYVKNTIFLPQNLEFLKQKKKLTYFLINLSFLS